MNKRNYRARVAQVDGVMILSMALADVVGRRANDPEAVIAWFDCEVPGLMLRGCALARSPTAPDALTVWPPGPPRRAGNRSVEFTDFELRKRLVDAAAQAYAQLGEGGRYSYRQHAEYSHP